MICGYATTTPPPYVLPIPFVIRQREVLLLTDDLKRFEVAQQACGADWVRPLPVNPIS
ncbi:hypothetical protein [Phenylobacterium sp.]|uniref:hypothetical protein n=1 Tax=Phenylobacterium sp. TaxID=1871053 RepID=UPI0025DC3DF1|nr:hypothetical protein [Phenylobacterium sp.]